MRLTIRGPWWRVMAQKAQFPGQPRTAVTEVSIIRNAGTSPEEGCGFRIYGSSATSSSSSGESGSEAGCCTTHCPCCICASVSRRPGARELRSTVSSARRNSALSREIASHDGSSTRFGNAPEALRASYSFGEKRSTVPSIPERSRPSRSRATISTRLSTT